MENRKTKNGTWWKSIVIGLITVGLSVGTTLFTSGQYIGKQEEKVKQLEIRADKYQSDHDLLIELKTKIEKIDKTVERIEEKLNKK